MKKLLILLCAVVLAGALGVACEKSKPEPIDVPFTEYSLAGTPSVWTPLRYVEPALLVIDSNEELQPYIDGTDYPAIDFATQTLLLANGETGNGITEIKLSFQKLLADKYKLNIKITLNDTTVAQSWQVAILTDKLGGKSEIELNVIEIRN